MHEWEYPRHAYVMRLLHMMDPDFLHETQCYFAGGTRLVMELGEYRRSDDVDFLAGDEEGWSTLRRSVSHASLGPLFKQDPVLVREVRADRYGIRTYVDVGGERIKFEVVRAEARVTELGNVPGWPVPVMGRQAMVAQKLLAAADRGMDRSTHFRDLIDLAYMAASWGVPVLEAGMDMANRAYPDLPYTGLVATLRHATQDPARWREDMTHLGVNRADPRLLKGLLAANALCSHPLPARELQASTTGFQ